MAFNYIKHQVQWYKALYFAREYELSNLDYKHNPDIKTFNITIEKQLELEKTLYDLEKEYKYELGVRPLTSELYSDCILVFTRSRYNRPCTQLVKIFKEGVTKNV